MRPDTPAKVSVHGALRPIMHEDKRAGIITIADAKITAKTIGLGVAAELDGEITIVDGRVLIDRTRNGKIVRDLEPPKTQAALLAVADVSKWHEFKLQKDVPNDKLDATIDDFLKSLKLNRDARYPIKIIGKFAKLTAHVIDGSRVPRGDSTHEIHMNSGLKIENTVESGTVVGFFSKNDAGVLTHHSTWTHLHIDCTGKEFAGHIDSVQVMKGSKVFIGTK